MAVELIGSAGAAVVGGWVALGLLVPMEAGLPIPPPADLVMFAVGERVAAGAFPLWSAAVGLEVVTVVGTTALFLACRGPGHALIERLGPRVGLNPERLARTGRFFDEHGRTALAVGRGTPGLRTVTAVAAGGSGISTARALPALIVGSSVFLQLHLVLGLLLGPLARTAFDQAKVPAVVGLAVLATLAVAFWVVRRGQRAGGQALAEAACPACLTLAVLANRHPTLAVLAGPTDPITKASTTRPAGG